MRARSDIPTDKALSGPGKVLLVDDQPQLRRLYQRRLTKAGHEVVTAPNATTALELASQTRFDLVISDVQMPQVGGVELLQQLHARDPDLPILLVSGAPDLQTALKAVELGAFEYLTKPVALDKLCASAQRAVDLRRKRAHDRELLDEYRSGEQPRTHRRPEERVSWTGELLGGRYRIGRLLGAGGMGCVYEALREDLGGMRVAVKIIHPTLATDDTLLSRFRREADTVAAINHPNIVHIVDFHAEDDEPAFLVMELLDGTSLRQALQRRGWLSIERTVFIASQMLAALAAVHRAHVIHRDIKPENIFLTAMSGLGDIVKLLDFGVAKTLTPVPGQTLTQAGTVVGTPTYMAPEQARGARVDVRTDLYSVAAVIYESLTGQAPFSGENFNALLFAIQQGNPTPLAALRQDVPLELAAVVQRGMAHDPAARFQSAEDMEQALAPWLSIGSSSTPPESSAAVFAPTIMPSSRSTRAR